MCVGSLSYAFHVSLEILHQVNKLSRWEDVDTYRHSVYVTFDLFLLALSKIALVTVAHS